MTIKKYSDFDHSEVKTTYTQADSSLYTKNDMALKFDTNSVELPINKPIKEEVLLAPKDAVNIEILEDKIIKFNGGHIKDILETIKNKYSDTDYYIRKKNTELHVVK